jgi:beta-lactamase regulating signal transducer with metallopeptidase domain
MITHYLQTSYLVRLACFSLTSFFLMNAVLASAASLSAPAAIRFGARLQPRLAARFILALRLMPCGLALFAVAGLCIPSYIWLEPKVTSEQVGVWCWALALLCAWTLGTSIARAVRELGAAFRYTRRCRRLGREIRLSDGFPAVLIVESEAPVLAVAGLMRSCIVISTGVLRELPSQHLDAALGHERIHLASRDNLKRLLMLLAPDAFPLCRCFAPLERAWTRLTEWAADDEAVAGDSRRSLSLASALVRVARMGLPVRLPGTAICFVGDDTGLSARVERLLRNRSTQVRRAPRASALLAAMIIGILAVAMLQPSAWYAVHRAMEHLAR